MTSLRSDRSSSRCRSTLAPPPGMSIHLSTGPVQLSEPRLHAVCELSIPAARQDAGLPGYDGVVQDLLPEGVQAGLRALAAAPADPLADPHDEAQLAAAVTAVRASLGELELYRVNPHWHILNLDLSSYDREYAPLGDRRAARDRHLAQWPDAIDAAIQSLDRVPAAVAEAALPLARGLASFLSDDEHTARRAHARFIGHLQQAAEHGEPAASMGDAAFHRLLSTSEASAVDVDELAARADAERERLTALLHEACRRIDLDAPVEATVATLRSVHPSAATLVASVSTIVDEVIAWTSDSGLVPYLDGDCEVAPMPESQRVAAAGMFATAPHEADAPSRFYVTPPDPTLSEADQELWLSSYFNRATLPVMAVHEVAPGHFAHSRARRHAAGEVRRTLASEGFSEGRAHYAEQLCLEEGFRADDPAFAAGAALDALRRVVPAQVRTGRARARCAPGRGGRGFHPRRSHRWARCPVRGPSRAARSWLRPLHRGQAGSSGPAPAGPQAVGRPVLADPLPPSAAGSRLAAPRPAANRPRARLTDARACDARRVVLASVPSSSSQARTWSTSSPAAWRRELEPVWPPPPAWRRPP